MTLTKVYRHDYHKPPPHPEEEETSSHSLGTTGSSPPQSPKRTKELFWEKTHQQRKLLDPSVPVVEAGICRGVPYQNLDPAALHMLDHLKRQRRKRLFWMTIGATCLALLVGFLCFSNTIRHHHPTGNKRTTPVHHRYHQDDVPVTMERHHDHHSSKRKLVDSSTMAGEEANIPYDGHSYKERWERKKRMATLAAYGLGSKNGGDWPLRFEEDEDNFSTKTDLYYSDCQPDDAECLEFMEQPFVKDWDTFYYQRIVLPIVFFSLLIGVGTFLLIQLMRAE